MPKKVLFITESLGRGGMERIQVDIANALVRNGYDVTLIIYGKAEELRSELDARVTYKNIERNPLKIMRSIPYIHRFYKKDKWETRTSPRSLYKYYVGNEKYDVEIGFYRGPSIKIISGSPNRKSKKIAWVHTDVKLCDPKSLTLFFNGIDEVKKAYSKFDNIVCVSNKAKESFIDLFGLEEKLLTVYNMISVEKIRKKSLEECELHKRKFTFVSVGRQIPDKGYDRLLCAVKKLNEEGFDFDLWLIGGGRAEAELREFAKENKLNNVVFAGFQTNPYKYVKQCDVFICSSKREGFNIAVAESLALGVPVLTTCCTGPTEILDDGKYGIIVDNSENGIYLGMKEILSNPNKISEYKVNCQKRAEFFDEENIMEQIIELIEK